MDGDMAGGTADEEEAWRDLVARFAAPAIADGATAPWPDREGLPGTSATAASASAPSPGAPSPGAPSADAGPGTADSTADSTADDAQDRATPGGGQESPSCPGPIPGAVPPPPQIRVIRPTSPAPPPPDDEHYVPPPPAPLPPLDPVSKGAWTALFGGPGYLLIAAMAGWTIPTWAVFCAAAAFIGGFATLVARMGDRPPGDSGPDDGAVV